MEIRRAPRGGVDVDHERIVQTHGIEVALYVSIQPSSWLASATFNYRNASK